MHIDVKTACKQIAASLKARSGRRWSVTHGRGTAYGWINVRSLPAERLEHDYLKPEDCAELARLFGLPHPVHFQGLSISPDARAWHVAQAAGLGPPTVDTRAPT